MTNTNIYPPIVETYAPTFEIKDIGTKCIIYFEMSPYNSFSDLTSVKVQIRLMNQFNNKSILKDVNGIKDYSIENQESSYFISIPNEDINGGFQNNYYYTAQLRFFIPTQNIFSEWSTIILVQGISSPRIEFKNISSKKINILNTSSLSFMGKLLFQDPEEKESLKEYRLKLFDNKNQLLFKSETIYPKNRNEINYTLNYMLQGNQTYEVGIECLTSSSFEIKEKYTFKVDNLEKGEVPAHILVKENDDKGCISIEIKPKQIINNLIIIKRASNQSNFSLWEDINTIDLSSVQPNHSFCWSDFTVESGIWYKYGVQLLRGDNSRSSIEFFKDPKMVLFEDVFITAEQKNLKLKFNTHISSYKQVQHDNKLETLGAKYPFIRRDGATNYVQFPISGMITVQMNDDDSFTTKQELYENEKNLSLYTEYNKNKGIYNYNDYILEKKFRDKVLKFLSKNSVKLFRSPTEGNLLIQIIDINLTPIQTLGRMIYNFSGTAIEVDNCSISNYFKYDILKNAK